MRYKCVDRLRSVGGMGQLVPASPRMEISSIRCDRAPMVIYVCLTEWCDQVDKIDGIVACPES